MYAYLQGLVTYKEDGKIVLENNGLGYEIFMSNISISALPFEMEQVRVFTYLAVREDEMSLYGFLSMEEKNMFLKLITVGGIGPKMAIGILSEISVSALKSAIAGENTKLLCKIKGLGKKTAERLVLELKDKINPFEMLADGNEIKFEIDDNLFEDAVATLVNLGTNKNDAYRIIKDVARQGDTLEEIITKALRGMSR